ncbi:hypothetical protein MAM1_0116d05706 [Mucor ambiguus]|uniref:Uncharacterized protein n=1 Tax=Mucor ambiguus TaxID=91626 RepID=A0A0C9M7S5_9FUNG|nr:hypothetical protein MAM1_0116d05706 [Mucor ambiguus]
MQAVGYKVALMSTSVHHDERWVCLWNRSALVPNCWNQRMYWSQAFELLAHLMNMLDEQDHITESLIAEHIGYGTASTLMGHTPHTRTFQNAYMGDFGDMNMTALMLDQDSSVKTSLSPLRTPATFQVPDIKRIALSETETTAALRKVKVE